MAAHIPMPGLSWRSPAPKTWSTPLNHGLRAITDHCRDTLATPRHATWLSQVRVAEQYMAGAQALPLVRLALARHGLSDDAVVQALALASNEAQRCLGLRPFGTQLIAARAVLNRRLAEMATGEGKTLAVALAAATAALAGTPVHVVTANDYLVERDANALRDFFSALGLRVGAVLPTHDRATRARAYACDIVYVTAKELVFDYLRDGLALGDRGRDALPEPLRRMTGGQGPSLLLRGLCMAIVDEADAILIDEARVPLVLSQPDDAGEARSRTIESLQLARGLREQEHYTLDTHVRAAELTPRGHEHLQAAAAGLSPAWHNRLHREHSVSMALAALHLFHRDRHYLVRDGKVALIDDTTGRVAAGRAWSEGLQQLIELKEGCEPTVPPRTLAQITYQRFFPRYLHLGGVSGTLTEARAELLQSYGVSVQRVPLRQPCRRRTGAARLFANHAALWQAVATRAARLHALGRPVLVGTDSVAEAQALCGALAQRGLPHAALHARNDHDEARIVAQAGQRGAITVTTNMAGRGTDILLGPGVAALGGLHLINCQLNGARRIDRQLAGRCARQGDPGSTETCLSLDTTLLARALPPLLRTLLQRCAHALPSWLVRMLVRWPQRREEQRQRTQRRRLAEHDERIERQLAFGGPGE